VAGHCHGLYCVHGQFRCAQAGRLSSTFTASEAVRVLVNHLTSGSPLIHPTSLVCTLESLFFIVVLSSCFLLPQGLVRPEKKGKVGGKKSLLKPDGTPYAPWMGGLVEEPSEFKAKAPKTDAKGRLANDPQAGELAGVGLKGRILGDEVDLRWDTGTEVNNLGFRVMRRAGKSDKWEFVADYQTAPSELQSKGPDGGSYTFIDSSNPPPGTWIYRVSDVSKEKKVNDLAQCMVDVEDSNDRSTQKIALAVLVVLGVACVLLGVTLDPQ